MSQQQQLSRAANTADCWAVVSLVIEIIGLVLALIVIGAGPFAVIGVVVGVCCVTGASMRKCSCCCKCDPKKGYNGIVITNSIGLIGRIVIVALLLTYVGEVNKAREDHMDVCDRMPTCWNNGQEHSLTMQGEEGRYVECYQTKSSCGKSSFVDCTNDKSTYFRYQEDKFDESTNFKTTVKGYKVESECEERHDLHTGIADAVTGFFLMMLFILLGCEILLILLNAVLICTARKALKETYASGGSGGQAIPATAAPVAQPAAAVAVAVQPVPVKAV